MESTTLRARGSIEVAQFWPTAGADADMVKLVFDLGPRGFEVRAAGTREWRATNAFDDAFVRSYGEDIALVREGRITLRLQRIDAPELHARPRYMRAKDGQFGSLAGTGFAREYRQLQAETAVLRLAAFLSEQAAAGRLDCEFVTGLDPHEGPSAAIDAHGRFVGDLLVGGNNLNLWLLERGLAIIALYDSLLDHEIEESLEAWAVGRVDPCGIATRYRPDFGPFRPLLYRGRGAAVNDEGGGRFIHPKFFRRQATWWAYHEAGLFDGDFADFLEQGTDKTFWIEDFQFERKNAPCYPIYDRDADGDGVAWAPEEFVFVERPASVLRLVNGGREKVGAW